MNNHLFSRRRVVGALSAAGAIAALAPASVLAQEATLRIAHNLPKIQAVGQFFEILAQEIEKNTATTSVRLKARTFPNGQLFNDAQLPDAISTGSIEIGQINIGFINSPVTAAAQIVNLPALWGSWEALWHAEDQDAYRSVFQAMFNKLDMQMLGFAAYDTGDFYANKPVKLPSDFKGLRLRGYGADLSYLIRELGASPVTLSSQEIYQATQRGTIDGFLTGPSSVYTRKLYDGGEVFERGSHSVAFRSRSLPTSNGGLACPRTSRPQSPKLRWLPSRKGVNWLKPKASRLPNSSPSSESPSRRSPPPNTRNGSKPRSPCMTNTSNEPVTRGASCWPSRRRPTQSFLLASLRPSGPIRNT